MLDLYKLRLFMTVAEQMSISKAAETHYMTQSAMSQHIAQLEATLGRALFIRNRRGVALTDDGERLFAYAKKILSLVAEAESALVMITPTTEGAISLGATPAISTYRLPPWTHQFTSRYPRLMVRVQTDVTGHIVRDVGSGKLDLGLIEGEISGEQAQNLHIHPLETVHHGVIVGHHHAWWGRESLQLEELRQAKLIMRPTNSQSRQWLDGILKDHHIKPAVLLEMDNIESIKRMVAGGDSVAILPEYAIEEEVKTGMLWHIAIGDVALIRDHKVVWHKTRPISPITRAFLYYLGDIFPHLAGVIDS
jgi:DNA-binding transcriptional LysR family regulator